MLVIMAHFDYDATLRAHTERTIRAYASVAEKMVIVTTSGMSDDAVARLPANVEVLVRGNFGYDFFSYKWGIDSVDDIGDFDRILVTNDSYIGPVIDPLQIVAGERAELYDFMGLTWSNAHGGHAQSYFFTFTSAVARSRRFRLFWQDMVPVSNRMRVITSYEVGLSVAVKSAGFRAGGYFAPTDAEQTLARRRLGNQFDNRFHLKHHRRLISETKPITEDLLNEYNPSTALADRVLLAGRLPVLKIDTVRFDPYELDADRLLTGFEARYPDHAAGVREFLVATKKRYPFRPGENNLIVSGSELTRSGLGYCQDPDFLREADRLGSGSR